MSRVKVALDPKAVRAIRSAVRSDQALTLKGETADSFRDITRAYGRDVGLFYRFVRARGSFEQLGATEASIEALYETYRDRKSQRIHRGDNGRFETPSLERWS